ncbi:MAG: alpha-L-fucosidase [Bacteroidales bacterium]|nr:alpha-L-fucosidase [Bacteroidales bacterium]
MKRIHILATLLAGLTISAYSQTTVEPNWESINKRGYPQWFSDARLGIFVHWGLYSVTAYAGKEGYGEWFYRGLMTGDAARKRIMSLYADTTLPVFEQYAQLTNHWHAEMWDPDDWAEMFRDAGAQYVMLVTKHHDGYCLWDSPQQPSWNSTVSGPHRNIVEELTAAVRKAGLRMCFYYSLPEWSNPRHIWMEAPDDNIGNYVTNYMIPQFKELVGRYKPDAIFADGDWQNTAEQFHSEELISWYYNTVGTDAIVNDRWGRDTKHGFKTPEYSEGLIVGDTWTEGQKPIPWAECRGIGRSFGFNRNEDLDNYLTDRELIRHFCILVANGGGLTLNVGPMADGTIPLIQQERLRALGKWLKVNGEAIYGNKNDDLNNGTRCSAAIPISEYQQSVQELPKSPTIDFDWVRNAPTKEMPVDNFSIHWKGKVTVPADGKYTLRAEGDDEIIVILNDKDTILSYRKAWAENDNERVMTLKKGEKLNLDVYYKERDLEATASLKWSRDGGISVPIQARWEGEASWKRVSRCYTYRNGATYIIDFERPRSQHKIHISPTLSKNAKITLLGCSSTLPWQQDALGYITIDLSGIDYKELEQLDHAWVYKIEQ